MSYPLLEAFAEGLWLTTPFQHLPATTRLQDLVWIAANSTNSALRLPLYNEYLRKPRPKTKVFDEAIQSGLAVLAAFAHAAGTRQAVVRLGEGQLQAISFQPRPHGANWTAAHAIAPLELWDNRTDPLPTPDSAQAPAGMMVEMSTRGILHLAGKTAKAIARLHGEHDNTPKGFVSDATVTFEFPAGFMRPRARAILRPLAANKAAHVIELAQ